MTTTERRTGQPAVQPRFYTVDRPEELTHLVCCRDHSWARGMCGAGILEYVNLGAEFICTMCVEVALAAQPDGSADFVCPVDHRSCPDDDEIDALIHRHVQG